MPTAASLCNYCFHAAGRSIEMATAPGENKVVVKVKVIPQKQKLPMNVFETLTECSLPSTASKNTIKSIGHHSRLRDMIGQSYPMYACTRANHEWTDE